MTRDCQGNRAVQAPFLATGAERAAAFVNSEKEIRVSSRRKIGLEFLIDPDLRSLRLDRPDAAGHTNVQRGRPQCLARGCLSTMK
jgi:hypothetical protein